MSDIDNQIAMFKARIDAAQLAKARAIATKETATATLDSAMNALSQEFGVDRLEDARGKLENLQADLQAKVDGVAAELDAMNL